MHMPLPRWAEVIVVQILCNTFARAFEVEAPRVGQVCASYEHDRPDLYAFTEFSAACIEEALQSPSYAAERKERLTILAEKLGNQVRVVLAPSDERLAHLVSRFYRIIGIDVTGDIPGTLVFRQCFFSKRYTPEICAFMSAFDSGFISGLCAGGKLTFTMRITEGCSNCRACFDNQSVPNNSCLGCDYCGSEVQ